MTTEKQGSKGAEPGAVAPRPRAERAAPGACRAQTPESAPPPPEARRPHPAVAEGGGARLPVCSCRRTIKFPKFEKGGKKPFPAPLAGRVWAPAAAAEPGAGVRGWGSRWTCARCTSTPSSRWSPASSARYPPAPVRAAPAFPPTSSGRPDPRAQMSVSRGARRLPLLLPVAPREFESAFSRPSCGFCLGMCGAWVEVHFLEGSPPLPGVRGRLRARQHVHILPHSPRECTFWSLVEVAHDLSIFLVHHPPPPPSTSQWERWKRSPWFTQHCCSTTLISFETAVGLAAGSLPSLCLSVFDL